METGACRFCVSEARAGADFCAMCGKPVTPDMALPERGCPECERERRRGKTYCASCGDQLREVPGDGEGETGPEIWEDGKRLIMGRNAAFPPYCVKCGEDTDQFHLYKLSWYPWWIGIFAGVGIIYFPLIPVAFILYFIFRRSVRLEVPVCQYHRSLRVRVIATGIVGTFVSLGLALVLLSHGALPEGGRCWAACSAGVECFLRAGRAGRLAPQ